MPEATAPSPLLALLHRQEELVDQAVTAVEVALPQGPTPAETTGLTVGPDALGVLRHYPCVPSREPLGPNPYASFCPTTWVNRPPIGSDLSILVPNAEVPASNLPQEGVPGFATANWTAWLNTGSPYKSCNESNKITHLFTHPAWNFQEFATYNAYTESRRFDREHFSGKAALKQDDRWKEADIDIPIPCVGHKQKEADAPVFTVKGLLYRDLVEIITEQLKNPETFKEMYLQPFSEHWKPVGEDTPVRVYGEVYSSDAMLNAQQRLLEKLQNLPRPQPEALLVMLMLASDSTFLTQFSQASMWPVYMFFGNISKYLRGSMDSLPVHHVAYLPKV